MQNSSHFSMLGLGDIVSILVYQQFTFQSTKLMKLTMSVMQNKPHKNISFSNMYVARMSNKVLLDILSIFIPDQTVYSLNSLLHIPILGSSSSAANENMMSKIWKKWGTII